MNWLGVLVALAPENLLLAGIVVLIGVEIFAQRARGALTISLLAVAVAAGAAALLAAGGYSGTPFPGQFSLDPAWSLAKAVVLALALPVLLLSRDDFAEDGQFHILVLSSLYGLCLLFSADSFLTLFLGLEIMALPVYVLVLLTFKRPESPEAALKYLILGGTATAMFLMGVSLLYGGSGTLAITGFATALRSADTLATAGVTMILLAFFLKGAIVPFHAWAPDAYEGASIPVTAYMATIIKAGVLLAALRLFGTEVVSFPTDDVLAFLPLVSIVWGNLAAMRQTSFRRMIAYSSIAHAGYLFYALLGDGPGRFQAMLFYVLAYGVMNLLAFASLPPGDDDASRDRLDNLKGLFQRSPYAALMIGMAMLSLAGIPPFPGFVAKFLIFRNVMTAGYTAYAVLGLVGSYLGIYFYLRVIQFMFMSPTTIAATPPAASRRLALGASLFCLATATLVAVVPGWVLGWF
jgi:NADH-quinone oxidoreductase subunit N